MGDETYNGWKNHATWCVNLHLSNDEPLYREALHMATVKATLSDNDINVREGIWTVEQARRFRLADAFKDWVTDELCGDYFERDADEPVLLIQDMVSGYLADVDWDEIADSWIEQVAEQTTTA